MFEPGETLAIVGDQYILAADVLPHVNQVLQPYVGKVPEDQLKQQRRIVTAQLTAAHMEVKLLYLAFLRKAPEEGSRKVHKNVEQDFAKKLEEIRRKAEKMTKSEQQDMLRKGFAAWPPGAAHEGSGHLGPGRARHAAP